MRPHQAFLCTSFSWYIFKKKKSLTLQDFSYISHLNKSVAHPHTALSRPVTVIMSHQKAPFSFHCTICYEFLNRSDRSPVVLPCGHTYICELCANRLDRCMECRESLFRSEDRLPTPKNHVLLCLMESVEGELGSSPSKGVKNIVVDEGGYQSGDDDELVTVSMKVMGNSSGTYMVREKNGLKLYRFIPKKSWGGNLKNKMLGASEKSAGQRSYKKNIELKQGQIVQVIHFINNIATLTRGLGYIVVEDSSQLVKGEFVCHGG